MQKGSNIRPEREPPAFGDFYFAAGTPVFVGSARDLPLKYASESK